MENMERLNPQQEQAVTAGNGQTLVIAGPGSGKTKVLTQRIVYLMRTMGVRPYNILAVTFTNKAAKEMVTRIEATLGESVQGSMWIGTFHSVCARILRREAGAMPFDSNFVIMDTDDQLSLIKRIIKDLNIEEIDSLFLGITETCCNVRIEFNGFHILSIYLYTIIYF